MFFKTKPGKKKKKKKEVVSKSLRILVAMVFGVCLDLARMFLIKSVSIQMLEGFYCIASFR